MQPNKSLHWPTCACHVFGLESNKLVAVTRAPIEISRSQPETRAMLEGTMKEIANVGRSRNVALASDVVSKTMQRVDGLPAHGTASMQRDIMGGRPSELCTQNGAVVRFGRESAIDTPINTLYTTVCFRSSGVRGARWTST